MNTSPLPVIDFHTHYLGSGLAPAATNGLPEALRAQWKEINTKLVDESALLADIRSGDLIARVVNTPTALLAESDVVKESIVRINDGLAALTQRHRGKIYALATIDAFSGEAGACELVRAVKDLGLHGAFVESAKGDLLLDAPAARPTLQAAADLGIPVFVHPINPDALTRQLSGYGRLGTLLARGTINAASLVALIGSGTLETLPRLNIVVTTLAVGTILLTAPFGKDGQRDANALLRRQVYVDTMGFDPVLIRAAIEVLGIEHVIAGSDWPIVSTGPVAARLDDALKDVGLDDSSRNLIASGNALRLLERPVRIH
jgi:predicted TIM-barrel fold metal-dependent hydrolase